MQSMPSARSRYTVGLTLLEVLIALVVLGALVAFAIPAWQKHRISLRRIDARTELVATAQRLQSCRASLSVYDNPACTVALPISTATGSYRVEGELKPQGFRLTAKPLGEQVGDACGEFSIDHAGARSVSGSKPAVECWGPED
jgi:type IV pilus assembly protein PilE